MRGAGRPSHRGSETTPEPCGATQLRNGLWERGTRRPWTYSLRKPGTSMSSSETRSFLISVSSAETRGRLS